MRNIPKKALFIIAGLFFLSFVCYAPNKVRAAPITYLQSTLANTSNLVTSLSATFGSAVGNGDLVVVATSSWNTSNTASISSVTDNHGNIYTKVLENGAGTTEPLSVWYAQNVVGGSNFSVTANTNSNASITIAIHEYSGVDTVAALDSSANTSGSGTSAYSGNTATQSSGEILLGAFNFIDDTSSVSGTAGNGYTLRQNLTDKHTHESIFTEDMVVSSPALYQATLSYNKSVTWRGAVVAFKPKSVSSPTPTLSPTLTSTPTSSSAPTGTPLASLTPTLAPTQTPTPAISPTPSSTPQSIPPEYFKIGPGYTDVIPHQLIRTSSDKVYLFAGTGVNSASITAYWTGNPGVPLSKASFTGSLTLNTPANPISTDAVYDGNSTVHVLANLTNGNLYDYPFDLQSNTFKTPKLISSNNPVRTSLYPGTAGVSGMMSSDGTLHMAYWSNGGHITYVSYSYAKVSDTLTLKDGPTQLDTAGSASHPVLAVSPIDGSITVAWVSEATTPHHILAKTKLSSAWGNIEMVSNAAVNVWTYLDPYGGLSVDQGPSLVYTLNGSKHLTYIEAADSTGNYGHTHYVIYTGQTGWVDSALNYYSHDPALATNSNSDVYVFGHGMYLDPAPCTSADDICLLKKNADGSWGAPQLFAAPPSGETFDASVSTKWSVVGWNRPDLIEVAFFSGQTSNYWNMNLYYGTIGSTSTSPASTPTPTPIPVATNIPTLTPTVPPSSTPTPSAISYVQSNLSKNGSLVSSTTTQFTNPVANGDLVVVAVSSWNPTSTSHVSSLTDNKGNIYTQVVEVPGTAGEPLSIWYAKNVTGGTGFAITVNVSNPSSVTTAIHEYHGLSATSPLDLSAHQTGSGTSANSGSTGVTSSNSELIFGAFNYDDPYTTNSFVPAAGFTLRQSLQDNYTYEALYTIDQVVNSVGQYAAAGTFGTTSSWNAAVVTFK